MTQVFLHNGPILTMDEGHPVANAMLLEHGRIIAIGSVDEVKAQVRPGAEDIDLRGRLATPGLFDAHAHIMSTGFTLGQVDVTPDTVSSIPEMQAAVRKRAETVPSGNWILGQGYDQASLAEGRHPTRQDLDAAAPDHPVFVWRTCHHIGVANSRALAAAGLSAATPDSSDGTLDRDESGELTGVLREAMNDPVKAVLGQPTEDDIATAIAQGGQEFRRWGVTSASEAGIGTSKQLAAYQRTRDDGTLALRTTLMMMIDQTLEPLSSLGIRTGFGDSWLQIGNAKLFTDGSIGGRTARMYQPYEGEPDNVGLWMDDPQAMKSKIVAAHTAGFQLGCHAIGDEAIELLLDAYAEAQRAAPRADARHRIEHCSVIDERLMQRIADQQVVPIPGTSFLYYHRPAYYENIGADRVRYAYAMRSFADRGIVAAASTDSPVVPVNPMLGLQSMVTRRDRTGAEAWTEEAISIEEALRAYTWNGAFASFTEHEKGSLEVGKLADVAIFDQDLRQTPSEQLHTAHVDYTIADGQVVYERHA